MSIVLNMVGGSGGGLKDTDALLRVQAPAGSTVTITKGTVTKTGLGHENADDHSYYDYYFIIHQSQFDSVNPWTVVATASNEIVNTKTIVINAADEYDLRFLCHMPDEYQEVEYIGTSGSQRIEVLDSAISSYSSSSSYSVNLKYKITNLGSSLRHLWGCIERYGTGPSNYRRWSITINPGVSKWDYYPGDGATNAVDLAQISQNTYFDLSIAINNGNYTITRNGTTLKTGTISNLTINNNQFICTIIGDEPTQYNGIGNVYYYSWTIDGVLNNELFPCYRKSDSVAGMYDRVKKQFVPNQGTGTFTVGGDVN